VLDLGCRPGSWLQYAARRVGESGALVGVDRQPLEISLPQARVLVGDVLEMDAVSLRLEEGPYDAVLSDMAPDTTGIRAVDQLRSEVLFERALDLALALLAPGGHFVGKLFQGPEWKRLVEQARGRFERVVIEKPAGSRRESIEMYVVGLRKKG